MRVSRGRFLKLATMAGAGMALPLGVLSASVSRLAASASVVSPSVEPFAVPLPVPPVRESRRIGEGTDYYEITQKAAEQEILPGIKTEVWGYDGVFPGPTIEARSGRGVVIRQRNELPVPVSTHLHGGVTPPESDGYPTDLILPKGTRGARSGQRRSGTTTTAWTLPDRRTTGVSSACTSSATRWRTSCPCRRARKKFPSS